jgi:ubiquilin
MYRNLQEPLMDAAQPQETPTERNTTTGTSGQSAGATGAAMPNPWGSSTTTPANPSATPTNPYALATPTNPWGSSMTTAVPPGQNSINTNNPWGGVPPPMPGVPNPQQMEQTLQMLENPMVAQMMDEMLQQNPEMIAAILQQNPMMQQMQRENPQMAQIMSSPEFMRQMMNPHTLRTMMQLQQAMGGGTGMPPMAMGGGGTTMPPPPMGSGTTMSPMGGTTMPPMDFSNLLNQFQSTGFQSHHHVTTTPADRFRVQLQSLRDMGFDDEMANINALQQNHGNLNRAVDYLLMNPTPVDVSSTTAAASTSSSGDGAPTNGDSAATSSGDPTTSSGDNVAANDETPPQDNAAPEEPEGSADKKND